VRHASKLNLLLRAVVTVAVAVICRTLCLLLDICFLLGRRSLRPWIWRQCFIPDYKAPHPRWNYPSQIGLVTFPVEPIQGLIFMLLFSSTFWSTHISFLCVLIRTITIIHQYLVLEMWADGKISLAIDFHILRWLCTVLKKATKHYSKL
jgi:hypothetical protein